jgi:hypothetical protein
MYKLQANSFNCTKFLKYIIYLFMKVIILFFIILSKASWAFTTQCAPAITMSEFEAVVEKTRADYFSEIPKNNLIITTFTSDKYFLQAQPKALTLLKNRVHRVYEVQLNTRLLKCPPVEEALVAILAHELEHVKDYMNWTSAKIVSYGIKYSLDFDLKVHYERATDQKVLSMGLGEGLALYREWVYQWLTKKQLEQKRKIYLTPEEIRG